MYPYYAVRIKKYVELMYVCRWYCKADFNIPINLHARYISHHSANILSHFHWGTNHIFIKNINRRISADSSLFNENRQNFNEIHFIPFFLPFELTMYAEIITGSVINLPHSNMHIDKLHFANQIKPFPHFQKKATKKTCYIYLRDEWNEWTISVA